MLDAIKAMSRLATLELEKDALGARLRIVRKEIKEAKTLAWTAKREYTASHIQDTKRQIEAI